MSNLDEFPLSTSAYLSDTLHLTLPQHGAYLLILMSMWRAGGWIADDEVKLANTCRLTVKKWRKIEAPVRALLLSEDGKLSQKRLLSEVSKELNRVCQNKQNGSAGGIAKSLKTHPATVATATISPVVRQNDKDSALPSLFNDSEIKETRKKGKSGISLPSDWKPSPEEIKYGLDLGLNRPAIEGMAEDMRLWARANSNRAVGRKADWSATFQGWMRREATKGKGPGGKRATGNGFAAVALRLHNAERDEEEGR